MHAELTFPPLLRYYRFKMKCCTVLIIILIAIGVVDADQYYDRKYDDLEVDEILSDPKKYKEFTGCLLNTFPCTKFLEGFKELMPELVKTACQKCTPQQKCTMKKYFEELKTEHSKDLDEFLRIYDPKRQYFKIYKVVLKATKCPPNNQSEYDSKFDNFEADEVLDDPVRYKNTIDCLLDRDSCIGIAEDLKEILPDIVKTTCAKCSPKLRCTGKIFLNRVEVEHPSDYEAYKLKYDPEGKYFKDLIAVLNTSKCPPDLDTDTDTYNKELDNLSADDLLDDPNKYKRFMGCLFDKNPCDKLQGEKKSILPEIVKTACAICSPKLRCEGKIFINRLEVEHPKDFEKFKKKYDPNDEYFDKYKAALDASKCVTDINYEEMYNKYGNVNIDYIFDVPEKYKRLMDCLIGECPRDDFWKGLSEILPKSVKQLCAKCTLNFKCKGKVFFDRIKVEHPDDYEAIELKYDPTGKYFKDYLAVIEASNCSKYYVTKYDDIDPDEILDSYCKYRKFSGCLLNRTPCDEYQSELKEFLHQQIKKECAKCTHKFKCILKRFVNRISKEHPKDVEDFKHEYDPDGKYYDHFEAVIEAANCSETEKPPRNQTKHLITKYDHIDLTEIVDNPTEYKNFMGCLLGKSPCNIFLKRFKEFLANAIEEACCQCSPIFKCDGKIFFKTVKTMYPKDYKEFKLKYDPDGKYFKTFEAELEDSECLQKCSDPTQYYDSIFDNFNVHEVIDDPLKYRKFIGCLLNRVPCDRVTKELKKLVPEIVEEACCKCSPIFKCHYKTLLKTVQEEHYKDYQDYKTKYDPEGKYIDHLEEVIENTECPLYCTNQSLKFEVKYDKITADEVLDNPADYENFMGCLLDRSRCDKYLSEFKAYLSEATEEACCQCSPLFKCNFKIIIETLENEHPEDFEALKLKFDPERKYFAAFKETLIESKCIQNCSDPSQFYDSKFDNININADFDDPIKYQRLMGCLLGRSLCNKTLRELKKIIPEAIEQSCCKCSLKMKCNTKLFYARLKVEHPKDCKDFVRKYDPEDKYFDALEDVLEDVKCPDNCSDPSQYYDEKFDQVDVAGILDDPIVYKKVMGCLLGRSVCDKTFRQFKMIAREAIKEACCKCSPKLKCNAKLFFTRVKVEHPKDFKDYVKKYDPEGKYFDILEGVLEDIQCPENCSDPSQYYESIFDNIDVNEVFDNITQYQQFIGCILSRDRCDNVLEKFKKHLPEAAEEACCNCSPILKCNLKTFLDRIIEEHPEDYVDFKKKYFSDDNTYEHFVDVLDENKCPQSCTNQSEHYITTYDNIDPNEIFDDPKTYKTYFGCLLDMSSCDELLTGLKEYLREAIKEACCNCSPVFKCKSKIFITRLTSEHPEDFEKVKLKYDPERKYFGAFDATIKASKCPKNCSDLAENDYYKFENIDVNKVFKNDTKYQELIGCILNRGPCDKLKKLKCKWKLIMPEVIREACCRCTPQQKCNIKLFYSKFKVEHPKDFNDFVQKYDPENKYFGTLEKVLEETNCPREPDDNSNNNVGDNDQKHKKKHNKGHHHHHHHHKL